MLICRPCGKAMHASDTASAVKRLFADKISTVKCHRQPGVSTTQASQCRRQVARRCIHPTLESVASSFLPRR